MKALAMGLAWLVGGVHVYQAWSVLHTVAAQSTPFDVYQFIANGGTGAFAFGIAFAVYKGWLVLGREYKFMEKLYTDVKLQLDRSYRITERTTHVAEEVVKKDAH